jgi:uncharacterized protein (TIGR03437 family)
MAAAPSGEIFLGKLSSFCRTLPITQVVARHLLIVVATFLLAAAGVAGSESQNELLKSATPALAITTTSLTSGSVNTSYSLTFAASGGTPPYSTWAISTGALPTGITLSVAGVLSGTPTKAGSSTFKVKVTDSAGASATSGSLTLTINAALDISTAAALTAGKVNVAYSQTLAATGGTPPYSNWTVSGGTLPPGLTLSAAGTLTGTPTLAGSYSFTVGVTDKAGNSATASFSLTIVPGKLAISTTSPLPAGQVNLGYAVPLTATGGTPPYTTWTTTTGTLPPGLSLSAGALSGVPVTAGAYSFTVQVTDSASATASTPFQLTISPAALAIATPSPLTAGQVNIAYSQTLAATGGTPPYANWAVASGSTLPPGLTLSPAGVLSGTPTVSGAYNFTVQVKDHASGSASALLQLSINPGALAITTTSPLPAGKVNTNYSATLTAAGGRPPYTWAANSSAPGLSFSPAGVWSGTPSAAGTFGFTVMVSDSAGTSVSALFQLTISPAVPVTITTTSPLPAGNVNTPYSLTFAASYGTPPYTNWTTIAGALPPGLTLSTAGSLSGTPTTTGTSNFTVQVTDSGGVNSSGIFQLTINAAKLAITTSSPLPAGKVNAGYSQTLAATGGAPPYSWLSNLTTPGLTLSSAGVLSGTPTTVGNSSFTVQVTDSNGASITAPFALTINPPGLAIATSSLPAGQIGTSYSQSLTATGGLSPYAWSITNGTPPPGLSLNSSGILAGTPASVGTYTFTVQATDKTGATASTPLQLAINAAPLSITTSSPLPAGKVNSSYSLSLTASGGTPPYANWTISGGALPPGISLSSSGVLSGAPTTTGTYSFTIHLTDNVGAGASASFQLTIATAPLAITTVSPLPAGKVNTAYSQNFAASGGMPPYTNWTTSSASLPAGLTLSSVGVLSGMPVTAGAYSFTIQVTDSASATGSATFQLTISPGALAITTVSPLASGSVGSAYSQTIAAGGGTPPYVTWTISNGTLPAGLTLGAAGVVAGTPTKAGAYSFTVQVTDKAGATASAAFQLTITPSAPAITTTSPLPTGKVNTAYSQTMAASGGTPPYTKWSTSGTLPAGLALASTGQWSGTPTTAGTFSFTVQVSDSAGASASASFQLTINPTALSITTASPLPAGTANLAYTQSLAATGGTPPYTWSATGGPQGLTLSPGGIWSGTPTAAGAYTLTIQVTDSAGSSASASFQLTIGPAALSIVTASPLPPGNVGTAYATSLGAAGGTPPYANWTASAPPPGLTLSSAGVWSGTPATTGTYSFNIQVTDSAGASTAASFQLTINQPLPGVVAVVSSASIVGGLPVTTGSWVALYGNNLAPAGDSRMWNPATEIINGKLPTNLDGTSVTVNGRPATVGYISPGQVNIQMPDDTAIGPVPVVVTTAAGGPGPPFMVNYAQFSPGFFPAAAPYIAAQHADNSYVTPSSPAMPGEVIILWGGGMGPANPAVPAGQVFTGANPLANTVTVTIGGQTAALDFAGAVGAGLVQINAHVPAGIASGDQPVIATVGGVNSPAGAYISVGSPSSATSQLRTRPLASTGLSATLNPETTAPVIAAPAPIYAGTDSGIYQSSDGGVTWQHSLPLPATLSAIHSILIDPLCPARIYAADVNSSGGATFFTSLDAGKTWSGTAAPPAAALALDAASPNVIYLLGSLAGEVYRSEDSGRTWTSTQLMNVAAIAADPNVAGLVYAISSNQILKSYDFGMSWIPVAMNGIDGISDLTIDPNNDNVFYGASSSTGRVFRSTDSGNTWQDLSPGESPAPFVACPLKKSLAILFTDPVSSPNLYALPISGKSNGLYRSADGGANWTFSPVVPDGGQVFALGIPAR